MRSFAPVITAMAMALLAISFAFAAPRREREFASAKLQNASGALKITNARTGRVVLSAAGLRAGDGVSGTVRIANAGDIAGRFGLRAAGVRDEPGSHGGMLSDGVELVLFDITNVRRPLTVFAGRPGDFEDIDLGTFAAGEERDYLAAVTLPKSGDRYEGSRLTLAFEWRAGALATPAPVKQAQAR